MPVARVGYQSSQHFRWGAGATNRVFQRHDELWQWLLKAKAPSLGLWASAVPLLEQEGGWRVKNDGKMAIKGVFWKVAAVLGLIHADFEHCS